MDEISLALGRLEGKLDALLAASTQTTEDHESRLRHLEKSAVRTGLIIGLATFFFTVATPIAFSRIVDNLPNAWPKVQMEVEANVSSK